MSEGRATSRLEGLLDVQALLHRQLQAHGWPVRDLMAWLLDPRNLRAAWDRVAGADGAGTPGIDGLTCAGVAGQLDPWLASLADDLHHQRYRPAPVRFVDVPKAQRPGATRRLGILTVRDRVVQTAVKQVLEPILEPAFAPTSHGFRAGRSVAGALDEAVRSLSRPGGRAPFTHAVHLDVADCFDTVDHLHLTELMSRHIADAALLRLLELLLGVGGRTVWRWLFWGRRCGLVQGGSLSPLLCNLALQPVDDALAGLARESGAFLGLRYADDLLLLAGDARLAARGIRLTRKVLGRQRQALRHGGASAQPVRQGVEWLGVRIQPRNPAVGTFGYVVPQRKVADMLARLTELTAPASNRIDPAAFNLPRWLSSINEQLRDWRSAYLFADNAFDVFRALDEHCSERVGELLRHVLGVRWAVLKQRYRVGLERGFTTWAVNGVRLLVLGALPPEQPRWLTHRPAWMGRRPRCGPQPLPRLGQRKAPGASSSGKRSRGGPSSSR